MKMKIDRILPAVLIVAATLAYLPAQREGSGPSGREGASADKVQAKLALNGLDPVRLAQGQQEKGKGDLTATHEGFVYRFASLSARSAFKAAPDKYAVQDKGLCPVAKVTMNREVPGDPEIYSVHREKIYLLTNLEAKQMFDDNPSRFVPQRKREGS